MDLEMDGRSVTELKRELSSQNCGRKKGIFEDYWELNEANSD
jgi:hypothetical protein